MYSSIKAELKSNKVIELYFTLCVVCICHVYSDFYESPDKKADIFREYLQQEKDFPIFSYGGLMVYLRKSSKESILKLTQRIILECMNA